MVLSGCGSASSFLLGISREFVVGLMHLFVDTTPTDSWKWFRWTGRAYGDNGVLLACNQSMHFRLPAYWGVEVSLGRRNVTGMSGRTGNVNLYMYVYMH